MKKFLSFILFALALSGFNASHAQQIVTSSPSPLQTNSKDVVITFHADQGNKGLMGLTASTPVYAHTGVITNLSNGNWTYAPNWLDNSEKYKLTYVSANTWQLNIGDIRSYYGITNENEVVEKLAFVFRNANGSKEGKTATGGDIFIDVLPAGFQMHFSSNAPLILSSENNEVTFTVTTTDNCNISLYLDSTDNAPFASAQNSNALTKAYTFAQGNDADVIAKAVSGTNAITDTIHVCYPANSQSVAYDGGIPPMGATKLANGDVLFCIAAPQKTNAMIIPSWNDYQAKLSNVMNYTDVNGIRYFWTTVSGLKDNTDYIYYYIIDGNTAVGDPYARLVLDPYNDKWLSDGTYAGMPEYPYDKVEGNVMLAVYNSGRDSYNWQVTDFVGPKDSDLIIYELLVRDFTGTEGKADGNGTIKKALGKLDYLTSLGVNAIELMPIQEFNGNNSWGYNTNFYFAPDKAYGSPDDYRQFIDECHKRGIAVILDVVFNQSDGLHPWYQLYPSGSNPFYNARAPHAYSVLNDWNQDNLLVQQQWTDMVQYWLTAYKVDGFRFDLVKGLGDNESYGGNASEANTNKYNASRIARMKAITEAVHAVNPNAYSINENLATPAEENEMAKNGQLNWANVNEAACQFAMGYSSNSNCNIFYAPNNSRDWGSTVSYAESHDEQRVAYKQDQWGVTSVKGNLDNSMKRLGSVAAQMILAPGAHMIWQFGELGNGTNTKNTDGSNNTDPKPVYWDYLNVPARKGLFDSYRDLIYIRKQNPDLFTQNANFSMNCNVSNWANGRFIYASNDNKELICIINPDVNANTISNVSFKGSSNNDYVVVAKSYDSTVSFDVAARSVTLDPGCFVVLGNKEVAGIKSVVSDFSQAPVAVGGKGEILINGNCANYAVYTLSGQKLQSLQVAPGMYIVVVDGKATKVLVR